MAAIIGDQKVTCQAASSTTDRVLHTFARLWRRHQVVTFQNSATDSKAGRESCFGDSGGGAFLGSAVLGDASYVNSLTCNATGSYQRVDTTYSRKFLDFWINASK